MNRREISTHNFKQIIHFEEEQLLKRDMISLYKYIWAKCQGRKEGVEAKGLTGTSIQMGINVL